jgi:ferredoxin
VPTIHFRTTGRVVEFDPGTEVNLLRVAIRNECGVPYKCASGNCGTDRVLIESGHEHLSSVRRKERDRLGDDIDLGYRLACQTYTDGDVTLSWDAAGPTLPERAAQRLRERWLAAPDDAPVAGGPTETVHVD